MTYEEIKEFVTQNPDITAEEFGKELKQGGATDAKIFDLLADAISLEKQGTSDDYAVFLKIVELFAQLDIQVKKSRGGRTMLDIAVTNNQADVVRILLNSSKSEEEKLSALNQAIAEYNIEGIKILLNYISHERKLEILSQIIQESEILETIRSQRASVIKILLDKGEFNEKEKINALNNASIDGNDSIVKLLLEYIDNIDIKTSIRKILEIIKESQSSLEKELKIDSEFKVDFDNSNHCKYLSYRVIIALLRSAINKKEEKNTSDAEENNGVVSNSSNGNVSTGQVAVLDSGFVTRFYSSIARTINSVSFEGLQQDLNRKKISLQSKCEQGAVLENALLEHAIKDQNLNVIKFLLKNGVTVINVIGQEEGINRYYISKTKESKSILYSVISDPNNSNAEILSTLLQNINAEQSKLNPEDELYRLYQQLKDDAFCTAIAENNSVAATVLIQNDQETRASAVNKDETPVVTGTDQVVTTPSVEENRTEPNKNISNKPTATVPPILTKTTNPTTVPNSGNGTSKPVSPVVSTNAGTPAMSSGNDKSSNLTNAQFSVPNEKEAKYKESKENFYTSLTKDVVGVVITGLFIAAAVMVPFVAGAAICGIVAALVAVYTGLHIKNSTLPSYREMEKNKVEHVSSKTAQTL